MLLSRLFARDLKQSGNVDMLDSTVGNWKNFALFTVKPDVLFRATLQTSASMLVF